MHVTKRIDPGLLQQELDAASVPVAGLGCTGTETDGELFTYDANGAIIDLPPDAVPVVDAHVAPPLVTEYAGQTDVAAIVRTTTATPLEVFRFPCEAKHLYRANLRISGIDAGNFVSLVQEGRFVWKCLTVNAILSGITVVSQIPATMPTGWATNCFPDGPDLVFTVQGAAGRTVDWLLSGDIGRYAPEGL